MSTLTKIEWTDHTFNPWWGCTKVSPGCARCYAEGQAKRFGFSVWGPTSDRRFLSEKHWAHPLQWNQQADRDGRRHRVFCASMADVFEDRSDLIEPRNRLYRLIEATPHLDWQILTKRPENLGRLLQPLWDSSYPTNLWLGVSVEDQARAEERIPVLLEVPAAIHFISAEPLLETIDLTKWLPSLDWVIVGGESQAGARPCDLGWLRAIVAQCKASRVPVFVKQIGRNPTGHIAPLGAKNGSKGSVPSEWPEDLKWREFPQVLLGPESKPKGNALWINDHSRVMVCARHVARQFRMDGAALRPTVAALADAIDELDRNGGGG